MASRNALAFAALVMVMVALPRVAVSQSAAYQDAVGQVYAAYHISRRCEGFGTITGEGYTGYQGLVIGASNAMKAQGLRTQKIRKYLFYSRNEWIVYQMERVLADRQVPAFAPSRLCPFARKIAGKNDTIGRFLVRE
ncbi:hypothetical protein [uncultured Roseobacter sp.]|uniref:hypothetical protein n=1 Tax=uncultured Roseobacter sp. TaxID=114847 RepID=UPI0026119045|nr:hypothetical protein [uncultured Roseobacter sp.]